MVLAHLDAGPADRIQHRADRVRRWPQQRQPGRRPCRSRGSGCELPPDRAGGLPRGGRQPRGRALAQPAGRRAGQRTRRRQARGAHLAQPLRCWRGRLPDGDRCRPHRAAVAARGQPGCRPARGRHGFAGASPGRRLGTAAGIRGRGACGRGRRRPGGALSHARDWRDAGQSLHCKHRAMRQGCTGASRLRPVPLPCLSDTGNCSGVSSSPRPRWARCWHRCRGWTAPPSMTR
ncbi:hypothetical protein CBM2599_B51289 [Cupriavidus taiwanensis]|nr:hypothetical protein CBM2599_B51289 [Cupriavidus taiwanensis]